MSIVAANASTIRRRIEWGPRWSRRKTTQLQYHRVMHTDIVHNITCKITFRLIVQKKNTVIGKDRNSGSMKWTASGCDLAFGSNPELRTICEYYCQADTEQEFADEFARVFGKVMSNDLF